MTSIVRRTAAKATAQIHPSPLLNRILLNRGVHDSDELDFPLAKLPKPSLFLGMDEAVERLVQARTKQQKVMVIGDYDCDGATSTALAVLGFQAMGFEHVDFLVPNRFEFGYGLSPAIVDVAQQQSPDLIFTVDNGVASYEGVERARELMIDVLITDHHLPPEVLPRAVAVVNPNLLGSTFPSKNLAGVGVCFYVLLALRARLKALGIEGSNVNLANYLDLVAIGTVADVVALDGINRILVEQGLRRIRAGATRAGVKALLSAAGRSVERTSASDIGFAIGPRLNAAGRIADMTRGIACLLAQDPVVAHNVAIELDGLNKQRRSIEQGMRDEAESILEQVSLFGHASESGNTGSDSHEQTDEQTQLFCGDTEPQHSFSIVLFNETWHQGVIGILAGRLKEQLNKPIVVFAADDEHNIKASARSVPQVHIRDVLDSIATQNPQLMEKFGGHAMAAGLTMPKANLTQFAQAFEQEVKRVMGGVLPQREWLTDGSLSENERQLQNAQLLEFCCPWGQAFAQPTFDDYFLVDTTRVVGEKHLKLQLRGLQLDAQLKADSTAPDAVAASHIKSAPAGKLYDAIAFNQPDNVRVGDAVRVVYSLSVNHYRGDQSLQLQVWYIQPVAG